MAAQSATKLEAHTPETAALRDCIIELAHLIRVTSNKFARLHPSPETTELFEWTDRKVAEIRARLGQG